MALGNSTYAFRRHMLPLGMVLLAALALCLPAIWNGFPLVYSDTGDYLHTAFYGTVSMSRPTGYGLFIRYTSVGAHVWWPILVQGLLVAGLLMRTVRVALPGADVRKVYPIAFATAVGLTGLAWYASQLMADVFTGLVALVFFLLLFDDEPKWWARLPYAVVAYWFCFSHYSHTALLLVLTGMASCVWLLQTLRTRESAFRFGRLAWALLPALCAMFSYYYENYANDYGWRMTRSAHVFTMARLAETGMLADYLHETCADKHWSLCPFADSLPQSAAQFIWGANSPFKQTGSWENSRPGYDALLSDFFSRGKYVTRYGKEAVKSGIAQMFELSVGKGLTPYRENSAPYGFFERAFPDKLPAYVASKQFERKLSFAWERRVLLVTMGLSVPVILGIWLMQGRKMGTPLIWFSVIAAASYVANAFLTGALANVYSRLQARIAWLIPLAAVLFVVKLAGGLRK